MFLILSVGALRCLNTSFTIPKVFFVVDLNTTVKEYFIFIFYQILYSQLYSLLQHSKTVIHVLY